MPKSRAQRTKYAPAHGSASQSPRDDDTKITSLSRVVSQHASHNHMTTSSRSSGAGQAKTSSSKKERRRQEAQDPANLHLEGMSMTDAKEKLNENRHKILREMGIKDDYKHSTTAKPVGGEVVRETVIEHKIQIPTKSVVKREVMREVEYEDIEFVSEEVYDNEVETRRIITVARPSMVPPIIKDKIVEVPEVVVKKNIIRKGVPVIVDRLVEVPSEHVQDIDKVYEICEVEYVDNVVHLEEEYTQYVDIEVPEIIEVPNLIEIIQEKHVTRDVIKEVNHFCPDTYEVENFVQYECPTLKPIYRDEIYTLNVPRIIQVPVYEDLLPSANLDTLYILQSRFDEMAEMQEPVAMGFVEDFAVQAQKNFQTNGMMNAQFPDRPERMASLMGPQPLDEPLFVPPGPKVAHKHHQSSASSSLTFDDKSQNHHRKSKRRWCTPHSKNKTLSPANPKKVTKVPSHVPSTTSHATAGYIQQQPSSHVQYDREHHRMPPPSSLPIIPPQHMSFERSNPRTYAPTDFTPVITETHEGKHIEKRSVDTNYVAQFVTNADPLRRHPPSLIATTTTKPNVPSHGTLPHSPNRGLHRSNSRLTGTGVPPQSVIHSQSASGPTIQHSTIQHYAQEPVVEHRSRSSREHEGREKPAQFGVQNHDVYPIPDNMFHSRRESASLYADGAAKRPADLPRMDKHGHVLVHPPAPMVVHSGSA